MPALFSCHASFLDKSLANYGRPFRDPDVVRHINEKAILHRPKVDRVMFHVYSIPSPAAPMPLVLNWIVVSMGKPYWNRWVVRLSAVDELNLHAVILTLSDRHQTASVALPTCPSRFQRPVASRATPSPAAPGFSSSARLYAEATHINSCTQSKQLHYQQQLSKLMHKLYSHWLLHYKTKFQLYCSSGLCIAILY